MLRLSQMTWMSLGAVAVVLIVSLNVTQSPRAAAKECSGEAWLAKSNRARINWRVLCTDGAEDLGILLSPGFSRSEGRTAWPSNFGRSVTVHGEGVAHRCTLNRARSTVSCHTTRKGAATFEGWVSVERGRRCRNRLVISGSTEVPAQRASILEPPKEQFFNALPKGCATL